jgi:hypothetical protein
MTRGRTAAVAVSVTRSGACQGVWPGAELPVNLLGPC